MGVNYTAADFPMGATVTYADATATTSTGEPGVARGTVNGEPISFLDGEIGWVPVWTERDNAREPTTILVAVANVLEVS